MGDPSEATGPSRPGPPGLGPEGPFGDLLRRRRHNSPTGGDPQGPTRVRRRVFLEEEERPVSGPPVGDPSEATGPSRPGPPGLGPEGPFGDLLRRRRHNSPTGGDPQGPTRVRRRVFLEEEERPVSGPPVGDPSEATGPSRPGPPGLGPEGPFGDLLRRRRHNSPTGGDPQGPTRVRRRVFLEEEERPVSGPPVGDPSEATGPSRPGPPGLGPEGPFGDLLRRRRHNSPTGGDPQGPTRVRRRVFLEEEERPVSGPPVPQGPLIQPGARSWSEWLARSRQRTNPQQVTTTCRRRVYIEEEEEI
uniref:EBNA-LP homolog n=1 Tax=Macacine gammaherpesvirus 4 TaxID=45455 RepID=Q9Q5K1_9GAMA|nr:EBNA-LP homolog [Macacine gammaherpesvirus 4]